MRRAPRLFSPSRCTLPGAVGGRRDSGNSSGIVPSGSNSGKRAWCDLLLPLHWREQGMLCMDEAETRVCT